MKYLILMSLSVVGIVLTISMLELVLIIHNRFQLAAYQAISKASFLFVFLIMLVALVTVIKLVVPSLSIIEGNLTVTFYSLALLFYMCKYLFPRQETHDKE